MDAGSGGLVGVEPLCRAHYSVSPSPILTSGNWQVGAGSQSGGGKGEKGRKGKMLRDGGGVAEPMEGWQRVGRGGVIGENGVPLRLRGGEVDLSETSPRNARTRRGGMQAARPGLQPY